MLLKLRHLTVSVHEKKIVDDVSFNIAPRSVFALVGGSGSGKTTTGLAILRLLAPNLQVTSGEILFQDQNLLTIPEEELRQVRGKEIGFVFQEPLHAFNPVFTVGQQIEEVYASHTELAKSVRREKSLELLATVGLKEPRRAYESYPHQLSGGMRQRAMIAQALALRPKLIIADEPTSSLDVTLQAKIIELFMKLRKEFDLSILLITHDLGVVKHLADEVAVMTKGKVAEQGPAQTILTQPRHEYTKELLAAF